MAELDQRYYSLKGQRSENETRQGEVQNDIDDIDAQIQSLQNAYDQIGVEKELLTGYQFSLSLMASAYEYSWKGAHATAIYDACSSGGTLYEGYVSYVNSVDDMEDAINDKIRELNDKKAEKWGILQGLIKKWNYLTTEMRNYFN